MLVGHGLGCELHALSSIGVELHNLPLRGVLDTEFLAKEMLGTTLACACCSLSWSSIGPPMHSTVLATTLTSPCALLWLRCLCVTLPATAHAERCSSSLESSPSTGSESALQQTGKLTSALLPDPWRSWLCDGWVSRRRSGHLRRRLRASSYQAHRTPEVWRNRRWLGEVSAWCMVKLRKGNTWQDYTQMRNGLVFFLSL